MAIQKIYTGSSWATAVAKVWSGSAWEVAKKFYDGSAWVELYALLVVSPSTLNVDWTSFTSTTYARVKFHSNKTEYKNASATSTSMTTSRGLWLDVGETSEVWVQRIINSGTLNLDPGSGRLAMTGSRTFGVQASNERKVCNLTFNFYDAASGGNLIGSSTISLIAEQV